jgi:hypothetical protein
MYPMLFDICVDQKISVYDVAREQWVVHFKIIPQGLLRRQWYELAAKLNNVSMNGEKDDHVWR